MTITFIPTYPVAFDAIAILLIKSLFMYDKKRSRFVRIDTGCEFSFNYLNQYNTLSDFQIDYPYYAIL